MPRGGANNVRKTECNFCECFAHAWAPTTNKWGVVIVDFENAHLLMNYAWYLKKGHRSFYGSSNTFALHNNTSAKLHRAILKHTAQVDHKNQNGLDCRRINLRDALDQNPWNRKAYITIKKTSQFKGVCFDSYANKWLAKITIKRKQINLGRFNREENAALAYNFAALKHFREFAWFNNDPFNTNPQRRTS